MEEINRIIEVTKEKTYRLEQRQILLEPFIYIQQGPTKNNRSKLSCAFNYWLNIPVEKLNLIIEILQMMHDYSILVDDIEDNSVIRRGRPVAQSIYGVDRTLNSASYAFCIILEKIQLLDHPNAIIVFTEQLLEAYHGQGMDMNWREKSTIPPEFDYKLMAVQKKGGFFLASVRLMQLFSTNQKDFSKLTAIISLYFQILDDYNNMSVKENAGNKGFCPDLTEGKFSFPIIHALRNEKCGEKVLKILKLKTNDVDVKKYFIGLLENIGSLKFTRDVLKALINDARAEVDRLGPNTLMDSLLNEFSTWVVDTA